MKILVVDDDPEIRETLLDILREEGCPVQGVSDGGSALQILAREGGWVVFLNWMMPGVDGRAVVRALQTTPELRAANQFILMSATAQWRREDAQLAAGSSWTRCPNPSTWRRCLPSSSASVLETLRRLRPSEAGCCQAGNPPQQPSRLSLPGRLKENRAVSWSHERLVGATALRPGES
jgi:CheY-like chemotaxis protein